MKSVAYQTSLESIAKALCCVRGLCMAMAFATLSTAPSVAYSGEDRTLEPQRLALASALRRVLLNSVDCRPTAACDPSQNLFVSPSLKGLTVEVFGITKHDLASKLILVAIHEAALMPTHSELEVLFFFDSKAEDLSRPIWRSRNEFVRAVIKGGSNAKR